MSDTTSISSDAEPYTKTSSITVGSDGSVITQMGSLSTDGSTRMEIRLQATVLCSTIASKITLVLMMTTGDAVYVVDLRFVL